LPEGMPTDIYQKLRKTWVSGKRLNIEVARDAHHEGGSRGAYGGDSRGGRPTSKPRFSKGPRGGGFQGEKRSFTAKGKKNKRKANS